MHVDSTCSILHGSYLIRDIVHIFKSFFCESRPQHTKREKDTRLNSEACLLLTRNRGTEEESWQNDQKESITKAKASNYTKRYQHSKKVIEDEKEMIFEQMIVTVSYAIAARLPRADVLSLLSGRWFMNFARIITVSIYYR